MNETPWVSRDQVELTVAALVLMGLAAGCVLAATFVGHVDKVHAARGVAGEAPLGVGR